MKPLAVLFLGVVVGWAASGEWSLEATGEESIMAAAQAAGTTGSTIQATTQVPVTQRNAQGMLVTNWEQQPVNAASVTASPGLIGRYSLKVQASNGYYVIDSVTGRVWYGSGANRPQLIAAELPEK